MRTLGLILLSLLLYFEALCQAKYGDVIITEIMADPSPPQGLPDAEFIELYNSTSNTIILEKWSLSDLSKSVTIPHSILSPDSFIILHAPGVADFSAYGRSIPISGWPALNNGEDKITLKDSSGNVIHAVKYNVNWHSSSKNAGGWSLEMIDVSIPCLQKGNWSSSLNSDGGTPGSINSVTSINNNAPPRVLAIEVVGSASLKITFDKALDTISMANKANYNLSNGYGFPFMALPLADNEQVIISYNEALQGNTVYQLTFNGLSDCAGNQMTQTSFDFIVPATLDSFEIIVNEILFNPRPDGVDYIELYNRSDKMLDLADIYIATVDPDGEIKTCYNLSSGQKIIYPGEYLLLTTNVGRVAKDYWVKYPEKVLQISSLPTFANDEGTVLLLKKDSSVVDRVDYNADWHFELIADDEGVSLEKINFDLTSNASSSWHSAASTVGYGTPTYVNSQFRNTDQVADEIKLGHDIFSPDNDGYQDVLPIQYNFDKPGMLAKSAVYDIHGRLVRLLQNNALLATSGTVYWDGITDNGNKAPVGAYIILFEVHHPDGDLKGYKMSCTIAERF